MMWSAYRGPNLTATQNEGKKDLGIPETFIIHVGTNDLRSTRNRNFLIREVFALVATAKRKFRTADLS